MSQPLLDFDYHSRKALSRHIRLPGTPVLFRIVQLRVAHEEPFTLAIYFAAFLPRYTHVSPLLYTTVTLRAGS